MNRPVAGMAARVIVALLMVAASLSGAVQAADG